MNHIHRFPTQCIVCCEDPDVDPSIRKHLRFQDNESDDSIILALHLGCYGRTLSYLMYLLKCLDHNIPGIWVDVSEPEFQELGGPCYKHIMSVQKRVRFPHWSKETAVAELKKAGYYLGLEPSI